MKITFEVRPGNKFGKRIDRADKRDRKEQRREKRERQRLWAF